MNLFEQFEDDEEEEEKEADEEEDESHPRIARDSSALRSTRKSNFLAPGSTPTD